MNNVNFAAVKHMAATTAAVKMLLGAGHEIERFQVYGGTGFPENHGDQLGLATKQGISTLMVTFRLEGDQALVDRMLMFCVDKKKQQLCMSFCSLVQTEDGRFALRLMARDNPAEYVFSRSSRRLVLRKVADDSTRAVLELMGLQALLARAAEPDCQERSFQVA